MLIVTELCRNSSTIAEKIENEETRTSVLCSLVQILPRVCPNKHVLTPIHAEVIRLSAGLSSANKPLVEEIYAKYVLHNSYFAFLGRCCPACSSGYVRFYYYAGKIAAFAGRYTEAAQLLRYVVSAPREVCRSPSEDQIRAYGLLTISVLISEGTFSYDLPPGTTSEVGQRISDACKAYVKLGRAFSKGGINTLEEFIAVNNEVWRRDGTEELIKDLRTSFFRHKIARFSKMYTSANISDVARYLNLQNDVSEIAALIAGATSAGIVNADIDYEKSTVTFKEVPSRSIESIDTKISNLVALSGTMARAKHAVIINDFDETV